MAEATPMPKRAPKLDATSSGPITPFDPDESVWKKIEDSIGGPLNDEDRAVIKQAVKSFALNRAFIANAPTVREAMKEAGKVLKAAASLQKSLCTVGQTEAGFAVEMRIDQVLREMDHPSAPNRVPSVRAMIDMATLFVAATRKSKTSFTDRVGDYDDPWMQEGHDWIDFIWRLSEFVKSRGLKVSARKDQRKPGEKPSSFVRFVETLIREMPAQHRPDIQSIDALAKRVSEALRLRPSSMKTKSGRNRKIAAANKSRKRGD